MLISLIVVVSLIFVIVIFCTGFVLGMWHGLAQALIQIPAREVQKERQLSELRMKEAEHITEQTRLRNEHASATLKAAYEYQAIANAAARTRTDVH